MNLLSLLTLYKHAWLKVCTTDDETPKEHDVHYEFEKYDKGFIVTAHHLREEPHCRRCSQNYNGTVPCTCVSTYMNSRCLKKQYCWEPSSVKEVYCVFAKLAEYDDKIEDFSFNQIIESYKNFTEIFNCSNEDTTTFNAVSDTVKDGNRIIVIHENDKILKLIMD